MIKNLAPRSGITFGFVTAALLLSAPALFAQDAAPAPENKNLLQKYVIDGGWTMIFIGLDAVALIALIVFNMLNLTKPKFCPEDLKRGLLDLMAACRVRSAIEMAATSPTYFGRMMAYSLPNIDATRPEDLGRDQIEDAIADFSINENRKAMTWINYISLVAQAGPMLGLLGTVIGMVEAFGILAVTGSADPAQLADSISVALLTTMWGLIVAIPALIAYFLFKNKLNNLVADCHHAAEDCINASLQTIHQDSYLAKIPEGIAV